ncbi:MAG: hypothetical protein AAGG72_09185 [Pseudomonadota bacterium]
MNSRNNQLSQRWLAAVCACALVGLGAHTAAAHHGEKLARTQAAQSDAIEAGRQSGEITYSEGLKLRREMRRIETLKLQLKDNDGRIDASETRVLRRLQNDLWQSIDDEADDKRKRWRLLPRVGR